MAAVHVRAARRAGACCVRLGRGRGGAARGAVGGRGTGCHSATNGAGWQRSGRISSAGPECSTVRARSQGARNARGATAAGRRTFRRNEAPAAVGLIAQHAAGLGGAGPRGAEREANRARTPGEHRQEQQCAHQACPAAHLSPRMRSARRESAQRRRSAPHHRRRHLATAMTMRHRPASHFAPPTQMDVHSLCMHMMDRHVCQLQRPCLHNVGCGQPRWRTYGPRTAASLASCPPSSSRPSCLPGTVFAWGGSSI